MWQLAAYSEWVLLFIRVVLGVVMVYYGFPKIKDLAANAKDFEKMGFKPGMFWGTIIAAVEFIGGVAVIIGLYASVAAALFAIQMAVGTVWKITRGKGFKDYSYDIQLIALALALLAFGFGPYTLLTFF